MTILDEVFAHKRFEVEKLKAFRPLHVVREMAEAAPHPLDFLAAIMNKSACLQPALIAEIKRTSPSRGQISSHLIPIE